ncbi:MAG TPA: phosphoribosyltransferase [Ktedonobacterales bacterium]|nr:phosphoribosyltransferase [Ktedonobacterales bacterium]
MAFHDRTQAGQQLAAMLDAYAHRSDVLVLGLPRGGVPVAYEVAQALAAPLDIIVVRKLGVPYEPELAMGAIALGGIRVLNSNIVRRLGISPEDIESVAAEQQRELTRRERLYRGDRPLPDIRGRVVVLVDDGIATGATIRAAVAAVRQQQPARIVIAVPVASAETCDDLRKEVDELVCALAPEALYGIGLWYERFPQLSDDDVRDLLARAWRPGGSAPYEPRHAQPY